MRRISRRLLLLLAVGFAASACNRTGSARLSKVTVPSGKTLRVAAFPRYVPSSALERFEASTGNKVVLQTYKTNEELLGRLASAESFDLIFPSSYTVEQLISKDAVLPLARERVENLALVPAAFRNPPFDPALQHCVPYAWSLVGFGYRSDPSESASAPSHFKLLFETEQIGPSPSPKVMMLDDERAVLGAALRTLGYSANTRNASEIAAAEKLLLAQLPRVKGYVEDPTAALGAGEVAFALTRSAPMFELSRKDRELRFALPVEGTLLVVDYGCVPRGSAQPEVAFAFLNYLMDPYVAAEITNSTMIGIANQDATRLLEPEARTMWASFETVLNRGRISELLRDVGPARASYEQSFARVKAELKKRLAGTSPKAPDKVLQERGQAAVEKELSRAVPVAN